MTRWLASAAALTLLAIGLLVGGLRPAASSVTRPPTADSPAAGFCRDMAVHHQQAVELSLLLRDRSTDEEVRRLAYDVLGSQSTQRGMMLGWLFSWGQSPTTAGPPMGWMAMPVPPAAAPSAVAGAPMPGMATRAEIAELTGAAPGRVDVLYLRLLITHHLGGLHMMDALLRVPATSLPPELRRLATAMRGSQSAELGVLRAMLAARARNDP